MEIIEDQWYPLAKFGTLRSIEVKIKCINIKTTTIIYKLQLLLSPASKDTVARFLKLCFGDRPRRGLWFTI